VSNTTKIKRKSRLADQETVLYSIQFMVEMFKNIVCLKVLSSEMDPAEIRLIPYVFIKERGAVGLEKSARPPIL
jgi:hypothetical protein